MALVLKLSAEIGTSCGSILFSDGTGAYDASLNSGGWGSPNSTIASVTTWSIIITLPSGSVVTITDPVGLPTTTTTFEYTILDTVLNSGYTTVPDGLYSIEYTVTSGGTLYTTSKKYILFTCNIECCIAKLFAKIATETDCACGSTISANARYAQALLLGLKANANAGNTTGMITLLTKLNTICGFTESDCNCN